MTIAITTRTMYRAPRGCQWSNPERAIAHLVSTGATPRSMAKTVCGNVVRVEYPSRDPRSAVVAGVCPRCLDGVATR